MFQFDLGQIGTLTPSPCSTTPNPVPLFQSGTPAPSPAPLLKEVFEVF
ncbi:MAG: hypothetical protein FWE41_00770 [Coriobacteriia bacterium]|nr:hypothetical protein [Coriobacteriia bacterium]MCL2750448.1 hypothetical protein [Coriobacteriia bacterium]